MAFYVVFAILSIGPSNIWPGVVGVFVFGYQAFCISTLQKQYERKDLENDAIEDRNYGKV